MTHAHVSQITQLSLMTHVSLMAQVYLVTSRLEVLRLFLGCVRREWERRPWLLRLRLFSITLLAWEISC